VREVIQNLAVDFELTMGLAGCRTTAEIDAEALVPSPAAGSGSVLVP
jgi:isopentenyl diphosphate isomerase/L-lactate dehydrogenase-like FMN-dependent dehydrogenase